MSLNVPFVPSVNFRKGRTQPCTLLVLHYTASGDFDATVDYLAKPNKVSASAHFVVGRDAGDSRKHPGGVVQLVDLDDVAYHAGESSWEGKRGVNSFSVGIEICNFGPLTEADGGFRTAYNTRYPADYAEPVFLDGRWWEPFTEFQYEAVARLCAEVMEKFPAITPDRIVGHSDVSPGRKIDPGPAWDWERFRELLSKEVDRA